MTHPDDNQLIQLTANGDMQAFGRLIDRYQDFLYSVCMAVLKNPDESQEATQDSFLKIMKSAASFNGQSKLSSWMYKIAYRTSLDYLRKRKRTTDLDEVEYSVADQSRTADEDMMSGEHTARIQQAIDHLDGDEAQLVRLFYLEEVSVKELAGLTDLSVSNVKVRLFRARKKLYNIIKEQYADLEHYK